MKTRIRLLSIVLVVVMSLTISSLATSASMYYTNDSSRKAADVYVSISGKKAIASTDPTSSMKSITVKVSAYSGSTLLGSSSNSGSGQSIVETTYTASSTPTSATSTHTVNSDSYGSASKSISA